MAIDQVEDLSALKAITSSSRTSNEVRFVKGHDAAGDPGAGVFEWVPNWDPLDGSGDDATIVLPTDVSSSSSGRWIRQVDVRGPVHAEWFGARGDGSTDDRAAIQACLNAFKRVTLLAKTYRINSSLKQSDGCVIEGQGISKTTLVFCATTANTVLTAIENISNASADNSIVRDLTIDCQFGLNPTPASSTCQAIALAGENILVERVKAVNFGAGTGTGDQECEVIALLHPSGGRPGTIQECEVTQPGNTSGLSYTTDPAITCLALRSQGLGTGGRVARNRVHDIKWTGTSGEQQRPTRAIRMTECEAGEVVENEVSGVAGIGLYFPPRSQHMVVRGNRLFNVQVGIHFSVVTGAGHWHPEVRDNLIVIGTGPTGSQVDSNYGLGGIQVFIPANEQGADLLKDIHLKQNYIQGPDAATVTPYAVYLELNSDVYQNIHVEDNVLEVKDKSTSGGFNVEYENAVVFSPKAQYLGAEVKLHGNRNLAGLDLRLKIIAPEDGHFWGPYSRRVARFRAAAFDGRVGLARDDFLSQPDHFGLGWTKSVTGLGLVEVQDGEAGHAGIVLLGTGTSSSSASAMLKYGENGIVLGTALTHVVEICAKRNTVADSGENYECRVGLMKTTGNDGLYFKVLYATGQDNIISAACVNGASSSSINSVQDGADEWRSFRIEIGPRRESDMGGYLEARFFLDGTYIGCIQNDATFTYIPNSALLCGLKVEWITGSTNKGLLVDYFQHQVNSA